MEHFTHHDLSHHTSLNRLSVGYENTLQGFRECIADFCALEKMPSSIGLAHRVICQVEDMLCLICSLEHRHTKIQLMNFLRPALDVHHRADIWRQISHWSTTYQAIFSDIEASFQANLLNSKDGNINMRSIH